MFDIKDILGFYETAEAMTDGNLYI